MKRYLLIAGLMLISLGLYSQTGYNMETNGFDYELVLSPTGQVQNTYDTVYTATIEINLKNISGIKKMHIKANKKDTGLDIINENIDMQNLSGASVPVSVDQNKVSITLGNVINYGLELDIKMQDQNDNESESKIKNY